MHRLSVDVAGRRPAPGPLTGIVVGRHGQRVAAPGRIAAHHGVGPGLRIGLPPSLHEFDLVDRAAACGCDHRKRPLHAAAERPHEEPPLVAREQVGRPGEQHEL